MHRLFGLSHRVHQDLVGINRLGVGGKTEIHVVDSAKKYGKFQLQIETALTATDSTWDFGVLTNGDVVAIKRRLGTRKQRDICCRRNARWWGTD